jgi:hypothetical protein
MRKLTRKALGVTALASAGVLFLQQPGVASAATLKAYGASVNALGLTAGPTPVSTVASPNNSLASLTVGTLLSTGTLTTVVGIDPAGTETATATVQNANASFPAGTFSATNIEATCTAQVGQPPAGSTTIGNGIITTPNQPPITVVNNPAPNTTVSLPGVATIVLNEQIVNGDGSLTVNGAHITILRQGGGDVILASATCGPASVPVPMISAQGALAAGGLAIIGFAGVRRWRMTRRQGSLSA